MKFKTVARGGALALVAATLVHLLLHLGSKSLQEDRLPGWVSGLLLGASLVLVVAVHLWRGGIEPRELLELTRRSIVITHSDKTQSALAWRMILSAELEQQPKPRWRLKMKNGNETFINAQAFTVEEWKKLSGRLDRVFRKKGIPIRVQ